MLRRAFACIILFGSSTLGLMAACVGDDPVTVPTADAGGDDVQNALTSDADAALADAGPACVADGEAYDLCDTFDDKGTNESFIPPWSAVMITAGTSLVRGTDEKVSSPQSLRAELPAVSTPPADRQDIAELTKTFAGALGTVISDFALRIDPVAIDVDAGPPPFPMFFTRIIVTTSSGAVGIANQMQFVASDAGIVPEMRVQGFFTGLPLSPPWSVTPSFGAWHHVRQSLTTRTDGFDVTVALDGQPVLTWSAAIALDPKKIDVSLGAFAGSFANSKGHPAYTLRFDDVRLSQR